MENEEVGTADALATDHQEPTWRRKIAVGLLLHLAAGLMRLGSIADIDGSNLFGLSAEDFVTPVAQISLLAIALSGSAFILAGSLAYATHKGWPWGVALLGLFGPVGVLVLWQLPTRPTLRRRKP